MVGPSQKKEVEASIIDPIRQRRKGGREVGSEGGKKGGREIKVPSKAHYLPHSALKRSF